MTPEEKLAHDVLVKDLQDTINQEIEENNNLRESRDLIMSRNTILIKQNKAQMEKIKDIDRVKTKLVLEYVELRDKSLDPHKTERMNQLADQLLIIKEIQGELE